MNSSTFLLSLMLALTCGITYAEDESKVDWDAEYILLLESNPAVRKKIEDGNTTKEEVIAWMQQTRGDNERPADKELAGEKDTTKDLGAIRQRIGEFVKSGKLTKEDAAKLLATMADDDKGKPDASAVVDLQELGRRLKAAVKSGEMTAAEAVAKYKKAAQQAKKRGGTIKAGQGKGGTTNFYAVVVGRLTTKDIELGEFTMEVDHVSSIYANRRVKDEIVGKKVKVTGVSGQFLDKLLQIRRGKTLKVRSDGYLAESNTLTFAHKFHVLEETAPFKADDFGVPPQEFRGFAGVLQGKIVEVGGYELLMVVDEVTSVGKSSVAAKPESIKGKRVRVVGFYDRHGDAFNDLHVGDTIRLSVRHANQKHDELQVADVLKRIGQN